MNTHGVFANVSPFESFSGFVVQVKVRQTGTTGAQPITITAIHPDSIVKCRREGQLIQFPGQPINSPEFSLTCEKNPNASVPFVIETNAGQSQAITIPAASSKILELSDKLNALQATIDSLRSILSQGNTTLTNSINVVDQKVNQRTSALET
jgi:hypothetical protein